MKKSLIIILVVIFIIILTLGFHFGKFFLDKQSSDYSSTKENQQSALKSENKELKKESVNSNGCQGKGIVNLTSSPMPIDQIGFIQPLGLMPGQHVTPTDHQYYSPYNFRMSTEITTDDLSDVLAPANGIITEISRMPDFFAVKNSAFKDYRMTIHYTCDFYTIFIHVYQLTPEIENEVKDLTPGNTERVSIPVKSGQKIGKANVLDFSLHNEEKVLSGFIVPEHYNREPWKIHTVDPYDYFIEPLRSQLLEKNIRKAIPYGGKIDYDIDGKLIGNWFKENTNGYQGIKEPEYWETHVSFSPNAYDPTHFIISLGDFKGEAKQFGANGNSPNPIDVDTNSGMIKYELVEFYHVDPKGLNWDGRTPVKELKAKNQESRVNGVVLVQLIEKRKLKLEIFPDKKGNDVTEFTDNAMIYER